MTIPFERISRSQLLFFISLIFYRLVLLYIYDNHIVETYSYYGFSVNLSTLSVAVVSWGMYLIVAAMLSVLPSLERPSSVVVIILFCSSYVPCGIYFDRSQLPIYYSVALFLYWAILIFSLRIVPAVSLSFNHSTAVLKHENNKRLGDIVVLIMALIVSVIKFRHNGLYFHFDLLDVYQVRLAARSQSFGVLSAYLMTWGSLIFAIRGVIAFSHRNYLLVVIMFFMELVVFSIAAHKFHLFVLPVALVLSKIYRVGMIYLIPIGFSALCFMSALARIVFDSVILIYAIPFRQLFLPAFITGNFVDYFSNHTPDFLQQSILGRLGMKSEYELPIPFLIDAYYSDGSASANTGLLADAYANFGFYGVFIFPVMFAVVLRMLDSASGKIGLKYNFGVIVFLSIAFLNMAFFTALLTGGVLVSLFFLRTQSDRHPMSN